MSTLREIMAEVPSPLRAIYEGVYLFGAAKALDPAETDVRGALRSTLDDTRQGYLLGGAKLEAHHFDTLLDLHQMLRGQGQPGVALLLAKLMHQLTSVFPENGNRKESVLKMVAENVEWVLDLLENEADPWLENVLLAMDLKPEMLLLAREVGKTVLSGDEEGMERPTPSGDAPPPSGGGAPSGNPPDETPSPLVLRLAEYQLLLRDPAIVFLRHVFAAHAAEDGNPASVLPGGGEAGRDLAGFDVAYFRSRFVPLSIEPNPWGGRTITILFRDKPDRLFKAWIYGRYLDELRLRGFYDAEVDASDIQEVLKDDFLQKVLAHEPLCA